MNKSSQHQRDIFINGRSPNKKENNSYVESPLKEDKKIKENYKVEGPSYEHSIDDSV